MIEHVDVPLPGGKSMEAALAMPEGPGPHPGVVVIHEIWGLDDAMRHVAERFASSGYAAIAPALFSRAAKPLCVAATLGELGRGRPGPAVAALGAARDWLGAREDVDDGRISTMGFCMGGGFALLWAATAGDTLRAAAVNHGPAPRNLAALGRPCPVVASYGERDLTLVGSGERLGRVLTAMDVEHDIHTYPGVGHSFLTPESDDRRVATLISFPFRVGYGQEASEDAWRRILEFFDRHVRGAGAVAPA